jgi:CRP/FNR family transcriptional regulator
MYNMYNKCNNRGIFQQEGAAVLNNHAPLISKEGAAALNSHEPLISKNEEMEFPSRLIHFPQGTGFLEKLGFPKKLPKGDVFIEPGDVPKHCYVIKKGGVIGFEYAAGGDERIYNVMLPGSLMLEMNLILNRPSPVYFKTIKPTELICIDRHTLFEQMDDNFRLVINIIESISYKFLAAMEQVREVKCHDADWRFCSLLLMFAERYGVPYDGKIMIREKVSQQTLSDLLGVNRITVNRIIKKLRDLELILQINGYYCIQDTKKLRRHMDYIDGE